MRSIAPALGMIVAFGLIACESDTLPTSPESRAQTPISLSQTALDRNLELGIQSAQIIDGFCFFVLAQPFGGYSGPSQRVTTPSGNTNYHCKTDLLFGSGVERAVRIRDVTLFNEFFGPPLYPCDIQITPGQPAVAMVTCHE